MHRRLSKTNLSSTMLLIYPSWLWKSIDFESIWNKLTKKRFTRNCRNQWLQMEDRKTPKDYGLWEEEDYTWNGDTQYLGCQLLQYEMCGCRDFSIWRNTMKQPWSVDMLVVSPRNVENILPIWRTYFCKCTV